VKISMIVAMGKNRQIGIENEIPWHLPEDLKFFKKTTLGHHIVMGRKTFESIGKPLPGRTTIILTKNPDYQVKDCITASSIEEAIELAKGAGEDELIICGGANVYSQALPRADRLYLTTVDYSGKADAFFPELKSGDWHQVCKEEHEGPMSWAIEVLER